MEPELLRYLKILVKTAVGVLALVVYTFIHLHIPHHRGCIGSLPVYFMPFILALLLALLIEPAISSAETRMRLNEAGDPAQHAAGLGVPFMILFCLYPD